MIPFIEKLRSGKIKKRIKGDGTILSLLLVLTAVFLMFPKVYLVDKFQDNILDIIAVIGILKGNLLRMTARGHKKKSLSRSKGLVTTGAYGFVRNPMYLGSFLIGLGFVLLIWPFWSVPLFIALFYIRFIRQVKKEEEHLRKAHGRKYANYEKKVPRLFPNATSIKNMKLKDVMNIEEALHTKEKYSFVSWLAAAALLESAQELRVFGPHKFYADTILALLFGTALVFTVSYYWAYRKISSHG